MANITLDILNTGEKVPVHDVDLEYVTNVDLIEAALSEGVLIKSKEFKEMEQYGYRILDKRHSPVVFEDTLSSLGFADGDDIMVVISPI